MPREILTVLIWLFLGLIVLGVLTVTVWLATRKRPAATGVEGMAGKTGVVVEPLSPAGRILIEGEYWKARANQDVHEGATVAVKGFKGLVLLVVPMEEG